METPPMDLSASILFLFIIAAIVALIARRLRLPYTVALVVAGLLLGTTSSVVAPSLTKELLFSLFLPGLLFEAAYRLEPHELWGNRVTIFTLALPGVVVATLLTTALLVPGLGAAGVGGAALWQSALLFA